MKNYEQYSIVALKAELQTVKHLARLVNDMEKPSNFTYIDVLNLHTCLEEVTQHITSVINKKQLINQQ